MSARENPLLAILAISKVWCKSDCSSCTLYKKWFLAVEYLILVIYNHPTLEIRTLYQYIDALAGRPAYNPPNSHGFGVFHRTVPELTVWLYSHSKPPIWLPFNWDLDLDWKWLSGTIANTNPSHTAVGESTMIVTLYWQQWWVLVRVLNIILQFE
jgi:hypothetical protein